MQSQANLPLKLMAPTAALAPHLVRRLPAVALLAFGLVMLYGVGFTSLSAVHNAAHDTRHAAGFPCH